MHVRIKKGNWSESTNSKKASLHETRQVHISSGHWTEPELNQGQWLHHGHASSAHLLFQWPLHSTYLVAEEFSSSRSLQLVAALLLSSTASVLVRRSVGNKAPITVMLRKIPDRTCSELIHNIKLNILQVFAWDVHSCTYVGFAYLVPPRLSAATNFDN